MTKRPGALAGAVSCALLLVLGCVRSSVPTAPPPTLHFGRPPWAQQPLLRFGPVMTPLGPPSSSRAQSPPGWLADELERRSASKPAMPTPSANTAAAVTRVEPPPEDAPLALTSSDGTGLHLVELEARAFVAAPLALTELHLTFENPEPRVLEGRFRITLPPSAAISRFAMAIDSHWQEGEVVERRRAVRTFEDFLHRKQDPALLEQAEGNEFAARVFPIAASGRKQLVVSYSEELTSGAPYRLRLGGLPQIDRVDVAVHRLGESRTALRLTRSDFVPSGDLIVPRDELGAHSGLRSGHHVVLMAKPPVADSAEPLDRVAVLVDTSASRSLGFDRQLAVLRSLADDVERGGGQQLFVACFDQTTQIVHDGRPGELGDSVLATIEKRGALGASDLHGALRWIAPQLASRKIARLVLLTDAVSTVGGSSDDPMRRTRSALRAAGVERLDVVVFGGIRDEAVAGHLVTSLSHHGIVIDGSEPDRLISERLARSTHSGLAVQVENATSVWPRQLDGIQAGDEVLVYAETPLDAPVKLVIGGRPVPLGKLSDADPRLVDRAWARARIESLLDEERQKGRSKTLHDQVVQLSTKHRVLSPYTAFLVLETQADYDRFEIRRDALADILTVTETGVAVVDRNLLPSPEAPAAGAGASDAAFPTVPDESFEAAAKSAGVVVDTEPKGTEDGAADADGEVAEDETAGEVAEDVALADSPEPTSAPPGTHRVRAPHVRAGATTVSGRLPPEIVQHIVRLNRGRFRACYHRGLLRDPELQGRVLSRFVIGRDGGVAAVSVTDSELGDRDVEACLAQAFYRLRFPQPEGGIVTVEYPLVFHLDGETPRTTHIDRAGEPEPEPEPSPAEPEPEPEPGPAEPEAEQSEPGPWTGKYGEVMAALEAGQNDQALVKARAWHDEDPGDLLALVALGRAYARQGDPERAARAYGSLIDLYSFRADVRRFASAELESLKQESALALAIDSYRRAVAQRPDHASGHHLLGLALLRSGQYQAAFDALLAGRSRDYPAGRYAEAKRVLGEDLALVAAAWSRAEPGRRMALKRRLAQLGIAPEAAPSLRFLLTWETDANDVDLHVYDDAGHHAFYSDMSLPDGGGELYADVTTGYGPEAFTVRKPRQARAREYQLVAHYYSRGPMGFGLGKVEVIDHDGAGRLTFEDRPFVVMNDGARVPLGGVHR